VAILIGALAFATPALADADYSDATGEVAGSADITTIHVANIPSAGTIAFTVNLANLPALTPDASILVEIDSDKKPSTGNSLGADYLFGLDSTGWWWSKWDATAQNFVNVSSAKMIATFTNGTLAMTMHDADIGGMQSFNFAVLTIRGTDPNNPLIDVAPNTPPLYEYDLVQLPRVTSMTVDVAGAAKAGHTLVVRSLSLGLSTGISTHATGVKCTARLGGYGLKGTGAGGCRFELAKHAKRKTLVVRVTGWYSHTAVAKTVSYEL
jgi:predicted metal-dependent enzyme (double-stranded beta helix superfamily)